MGAFSDYLEGKIIDSTLRGQTFPTISTIWIGLSTASPTDAGTTNETSGTNYARVSVSASTANFSSHGAAGPSSNSNTITFPQAGGSWGTVTHIFASDASSGGNMLYYGALTASKAVAANDTVSLAAAAFAITLD
jgi:hypothetical protein